MKTFTLLIAILFAVGLNTSFTQNTWKKKANFGGTGRYAAAGFSIGSKGYIGTGYDGSNRKDFWEYDPATNVWTQKADFGGSARRWATGLSIGTKGYIGTGQEDGYIDKNDFWEYDPASNHWTQKANVGGPARLFAVGFSIGSKGYIGTGNNADCCGYGDTYKDFWEYDPGTDKWTQKADFGGVARYVAVGFSIGNNGYIGTGFDHDQNVYKDFWEYDPITNAWTRKADYVGATPASGFGFSIGNKGYIGGGYVGSGTPGNDFWEYDPATNGWTQKANIGGTAGDAGVGFSIGGKGYFAAGHGFAKDFWEYTPENTCPAPTGMKVQDVSGSTAILKWKVAGTEILHVRVRYRAVGGTPWTIKNKQGDKPTVHIDGLTPSTTYQWQTRSFCVEDTSGWVVGLDFTTAASLNPGTKATAYPNPAKNAITVNYSTTKNGKYIFEITNASGNIVLRKEANAIPGANRITLDISRFFKGVYFINIIKPDMTRERIQLNKE